MTNGHDYPGDFILKGKCRYCKKHIMNKDRFSDKTSYVHIGCSPNPEIRKRWKKMKKEIEKNDS